MGKKKISILPAALIRPRGHLEKSGGTMEQGGLTDEYTFAKWTPFLALVTVDGRVAKVLARGREEVSGLLFLTQGLSRRFVVAMNLPGMRAHVRGFGAHQLITTNYLDWVGRRYYPFLLAHV